MAENGLRRFETSRTNLQICLWVSIGLCRIGITVNIACNFTKPLTVEIFRCFNKTQIQFMGIPEICISFIIALIGIAYPLMLQVISRLEDKYSSIHVLNLIKGEIVWKIYRISISVSLIIILLYVVINYPLIETGQNFHISLHVIVIALVIGSVISITSFLLFTKIIFDYDSTTTLVKN